MLKIKFVITSSYRFMIEMSIKCRAPATQWVRYILVGLPNNSYTPITNMAWVRVLLCKLQKRCTWLADASNKVYQLLAHGWWFSPGTPASSTTKTGHHDIAEILLKVALNTINQINKMYLVKKYVKKEMIYKLMFINI